MTALILGLTLLAATLPLAYLARRRLIADRHRWEDTVRRAHAIRLAESLSDLGDAFRQIGVSVSLAAARFARMGDTIRAGFAATPESYTGEHRRETPGR